MNEAGRQLKSVSNAPARVHLPLLPNGRISIMDRYIFARFWATYLVTLTMFVLIAVVFDVVEKLEDFLSKDIPLSEIVGDYYLNFIPFFAVLFTPLFVFVSVIFFTSRMAFRNELVALLNAGITYRRLLVPYLATAFLITAANIYANHWVLPPANRIRLAFTDAYIGWRQQNPDRHVHMQVAPGQFMYVESFTVSDSTGYRFAYEVFDGYQLTYKLRAERIHWRSDVRKWEIKNFTERHLAPMQETLRFGKDTLIAYVFTPSDLKKDRHAMETLNARELRERIAELRLRGADNVAAYEVEKHRRTSFPFAIPILTLIGVSLSSRKVRGGIGLHVGLGILLAFAYLLFLQFSQTFATSGSLPAVIAVWIPNLLFGLLAVWLLTRSPN